jgi:hypothetical protein
MQNLKNIFSKSLIIIMVSLYACAPNTRITGSWMNPDAQREYDDILVSAMTEKVAVKQIVEDLVAAELQARDVDVTKSITLFPPKFTEEQMNDKDAMLSAIRGNGHDAILTIALIDEETESRYVPGTTTYAPLTTYNYYSSFWGYYTHRYPVVSDAGYYAQDKIYFIELNLYDARSEELVWSAQTETINPGSLNDQQKNLQRLLSRK